MKQALLIHLPADPRLPMQAKMLFTAFMAVLVPFYWDAYGPTNFLYFCDVSLFLTLAGMWLESALLVSVAAVGIVFPQLVWVVDFGSGLAGYHLVGMTEYMFRESSPLFARGLSLFHGWLPILLLWLVRRLGYDRRALGVWTGLAWTLMLFCYFFMPAPGAILSDPAIPVNINYVFGPRDAEAQTWLAPGQYLVVLMGALVVLLWLPSHFALKRWMPAPALQLAAGASGLAASGPGGRGST